MDAAVQPSSAQRPTQPPRPNRRASVRSTGDGRAAGSEWAGRHEEKSRPRDPDVTLTFPGSPEYVGLARLAAAAVAVRAGLSIDEVDDVRIAVDEMCFALIEGTANGRLRVQFTLDPNVFTVESAYSGPIRDSDSPALEVPALARQILGSVVDCLEADLGPERRMLRAAKWLTMPDP
jgi:histidine kinase-like protein